MPTSPCDGTGGAVVVAGEHDRVDGLRVQHPDLLGGLGSQFVSAHRSGRQRARRFRPPRPSFRGRPSRLRFPGVDGIDEIGADHDPQVGGEQLHLREQQQRCRREGGPWPLPQGREDDDVVHAGVRSTKSTPTSSTRSNATIRERTKTTTGTMAKFTTITAVTNRQSRSASPMRAKGTPKNVAYGSSPSTGLIANSNGPASEGTTSPRPTPTKIAPR